MGGVVKGRGIVKYTAIAPQTDWASQRIKTSFLRF